MGVVRGAWLTALAVFAGCGTEVVGGGQGIDPRDDPAPRPDANPGPEPDPPLQPPPQPPQEPRCEARDAQPVDGIWEIGDRRFRVHVPPSYDPTRPTPIVLGFHGLSFDSMQQAGMSRLDAKADAEGFIAVHGDGTGLPRSWNAGACCAPATIAEVDDVAVVAAFLDEAEARLCVDPARVYATGFSNGGFLSHRLACELSDRIAAVAPVAGVNGLETCAPPRAVPVMHFHGTDDLLVPWGGGGANGFRSAPDSVAGWRDRNGCAETAVESYHVGEATCQTWSCADDAEVTFCAISGGGHTWPGGVPLVAGGHTTEDISATDEMWRFFERHPLADD